jgi:hypothetical protein
VALEEISLADAAAPAGALRRARACAGFFLPALLALLLGGCIALPQSEALRANPPANLPARAELTAVPYHTQDDFLCGPASLAMVFNAAGVPASVESLTPLVYLPGRHGSLQAEMLGATRRSGLVAYTLAPELEAVLREVAAGTPVVVLLNLAFRWYPIWHYAVIVGYDLERELIVMRGGRDGRDEMRLGFFEYLWQAGDHWAMLAAPPGRLPATAREQDFPGAVAALERVGQPRAARESYRALLGRWPDNLVGLFGLGNVEFALGDSAAAAAAFRRASEAHPQSAPAFNNLAHALATLGRLAEAEAAARKAVELGGTNLPEAQKTLDSILARRR